MKKQKTLATSLGGLALLLSGCAEEPNVSTAVEEREAGLAVHTNASVDDLWSRANRYNISFCVDPTGFGAQRTRLVTALYRAMSEYENAANVRFVHRTDQDPTCSKNNNNVLFNVSFAAAAAGNFFARMGYPSFNRPDRWMEVKDPSTWSDQFLLAVLTHELGHGLGFVHEHIRVAGTTCPESTTFRSLTAVDNKSALFNIHCPGYFDVPTPPTEPQPNFVSQWDAEGAQSVYEAPTNVLNTAGGTVYARKRSNGDIYKWLTGKAWSKIGGPGQAFVAVNNTLYGQTPGRGNVVQYSGSGTSWSTIRGASGQIFRCGSTICATDPNTQQILKYNLLNSTWAVIGGGGDQFGGTNVDIYGIGPSQNYVAKWNGSGANWTIVGTGGAAELITGGNSIYRLPPLVDRIERLDNGTWTTIGGDGRQFLASNNDLYGLRPDRSAIMKYAGSQWNSIHGPADRIYGQNGKLFAELSNGDIERYDTAAGTWTNLGQP